MKLELNLGAPLRRSAHTTLFFFSPSTHDLCFWCSVTLYSENVSPDTGTRSGTSMFLDFHVPKWPLRLRPEFHHLHLHQRCVSGSLVPYRTGPGQGNAIKSSAMIGFAVKAGPNHRLIEKDRPFAQAIRHARHARQPLALTRSWSWWL